MALNRTFRSVGSSLAALLAGSIWVAPPALAQQERIDTPYEWIDPSLRVGLYVGNISTSRGASDLGIGSSMVIGSRLRARLSSPLSFELSAGFGSSSRAVIDPRLETGPAAVDSVDVDWLLLEGGFQIALTGARTLHGIQPYVTLTGGILQGLSEPRSDSLLAVGDELFRFEVGTTAVFSGGLGLEWIPSERLGFGIELRDHLWRINTPDGFFQASVLQRIEELGLPAPEDSEWAHNIELSASLYYYF